ncbi:group 1 truncated hemoglobin [Paraburkholderia sp. CNPSo 3274]|uniref:group I truncated hemoglobin n=1 Tax=Paraburkholderia sp. CNPSo 3274 TaxID=2940932 RepID=UPI0020B7938A|nr:group 1 truncated hemoglobin [Paraburkholderia sp. CNPSo 3274]MCP3712952.1 group 1 truncated hemoglobin [Paraburkholderia sp. CNPSo 3274]
MTSLYERLGGAPALDVAVDKFYENVLEDTRINHFFRGVDMPRLRRHQKSFLAYAFGGVPAYDGRTLRAAHGNPRALGLNDDHFDAVMENLSMALQELGVASELIEEVRLVAESVRADVLNR